jgi:hypothetical protein
MAAQAIRELGGVVLDMTQASVVFPQSVARRKHDAADIGRESRAIQYKGLRQRDTSRCSSFGILYHQKPLSQDVRSRPSRAGSTMATQRAWYSRISAFA